MARYAKPLARDKDGAPMTGQVAPFVALQRYDNENATASSVITLTDNTTAIELAAVGGTAVMRWVPSSDTQASVVSATSGANYDHVIPTGTFRRFVVPIERGVLQSSVVGANIQNGLYNRVAFKTIGIASVLASEY